MKRKRSSRSEMSAETQTEQVQQPQQDPKWRLATRIAFRFSFVYLGLYSLATQIAGGLFLVPGISFRGFGPLWPMRQITSWIATSIFDINSPFPNTGNSADTPYFWIQALWLLLSAILITGVWSVLDQRRESYITLHKWFRLFIRLGFASQMFEYGMTKVIPTQFPAPSLTTLVEPVGDLPLQGLLWTSVGASKAYEVFTGCAELLGGLFLLIPRTTMVGAMICLADMIHVFTLNMTYDIGLKQFSFHLILMILFLLAPDFKRITNFLFLNRPVEPSSHPHLFRTPQANRIALAAQIVFGFYLLGMYATANRNYWSVEGDGSPRSPLYGIWNVEQLSIDGQVRPPTANDYDRRWRRVIFDSPNEMAFQRTDDSFAHYGASVNVRDNMITLTKGGSRKWKATFSFQRPAPDQLVLDGTMDDYRIHMELQLVDFDRFRLLNSNFRWTHPPKK